MHIGSWRRKTEEGNRSLSYRELAPQLAEYLVSLGYTHVELLPVMDHPFFGSWGYQITGYFAPSANYGTPQDLMFLIDTLHQNNIGVIFDWVPSHFPGDAHGLAYFDGTHLFEPADPRRQQEHAEASTFPWAPHPWTIDTGSPLIWPVSRTIISPTRRRRMSRCGTSGPCAVGPWKAY